MDRTIMRSWIQAIIGWFAAFFGARSMEERSMEEEEDTPVILRTERALRQRAATWGLYIVARRVEDGYELLTERPAKGRGTVDIYVRA
jgi:hypothetical protein